MYIYTYGVNLGAATQWPELPKLRGRLQLEACVLVFVGNRIVNWSDVSIILGRYLLKLTWGGILRDKPNCVNEIICVEVVNQVAK